VPSTATAIHDAWGVAGSSSACPGSPTRWWFDHQECLAASPGGGTGIDAQHRVWGFAGSLHSYQMRVWGVDGQVTVPPGLYTWSHRIFAVHEHGVATGEYEGFSPEADSQATSALRVPVAGATALPRLGGDTPECAGTAVNAAGDVGGSCVSLAFAGRVGRAALWPASGGLVALSRTNPLPAPWRLAEVRGLSDEGVIVAVAGIPEHGSERTGVLLTPMPQGPPSVAMTVNGQQFTAGQTLTVGLKIQNPGTAELYCGVPLPQGQLLLLAALTPLGGVLTTLEQPETFLPLTPMPTGMSSTFTGGEQPGVYHLVVALAPPGAFSDGPIDDGDILALDWTWINVQGGATGLSATRRAIRARHGR
jgi:hypothetical protein